MSYPTHLFILLTENKSNASSSETTGDVPYSEGTADTELNQQQIHFSDMSGGTSVKFESTDLSSYDKSILSDLDLGSFLSRPVLIDTFDWAENTFFAHTFNPWSLYLTHSTIAKKLDNYGLLRCKLKLKFIISASPFYYGLGLISYNPTPSTHAGPIVIVGGDEQMVTYSQRPHIWVRPSTSEGGEMELPFYYWKNWLNNISSDISGMGEIRYDSSRVLKNANSVAGVSVTVRCYAWAEDMELSAPTMQLQSKRISKAKFKKRSGGKSQMMDKISSFGTAKDEYGDGPVSGIASAVAAAGSALSNVPMIGPFARATEIGAGAVSRVAAWFGFTNVPIISDVAPFKDLPFGGLASSEISAPTPKLTLDPKNELTIDSRTVGLDGTDELALENFAGIESYLTTFSWDTTDASDAPIWSCDVAPHNLFRSNGTSNWATPIHHVTTMYGYWSGSIIFRFQIVGTQYHRGRFKIVFEPSQFYSPSGVQDESATITRIFDIGETNDVEICVPYMQAEAFLQTLRLPTRSSVPFTETVGSLSSLGAHNGNISVRVCNELTSPIANAPVDIVVSVKAGDDFCVLGPLGPPPYVTWRSQSNVVADDTITECLGDTDDSVPGMNLVYGGESAVSLRQLLHRHCFIRPWMSSGQTSSILNVFSMYPPSPNPSSTSSNMHTDGLGATVNYVSNSYVAWISPCFSGRRGSMYWAFNTSSDAGAGARAIVSRRPDMAIPPSRTLTVTDVYSSTDFIAHQYVDLGYWNTGAGSAVYNTLTQAGVTALVPFISNRRFNSTWANCLETGDQRVGTKDEVVLFSYRESRSSGVRDEGGEMYCATGPDFNLFFFTGVPTYKTFTAWSAP